MPDYLKEYREKKQILVGFREKRERVAGKLEQQFDDLLKNFKVKTLEEAVALKEKEQAKLEAKEVKLEEVLTTMDNIIKKADGKE